MSDNSSKTELFTFLADTIVKMCSNNTVIVTQEDGVVCNQSISVEGLTHCNHEEADTRIFLHSKHAAADGNNTIIIKASDTDVLVIAVSVLPILQDLGVEKQWVAFGQGQNLKWTPIHEISPSIGPEKSKGLLFFTLLLAVMYLHSVVKGNRVHGNL